ncbi:MAG: phage portal protein [Solirubrobacteraceae bacterium]
MGFFRRAKDETRSLPPAENQLPLIGAYTATTVTPAQALAIGDVWAAVRVLADAASSLPLHVYRKNGDGRERVTSGRLVDLLDRPAPATTQADLISSLMCHLAIWGNGYVAKFRQQGEVVQLGLLHPERVRPELQGGQMRWRYSPGVGPDQLLTDADLVHVKGLTVDGLLGLSAVTQAGRVLGLSDELVKHALDYFEQGGGLPSATFKMPLGSSEDQKERYVEALRNRARPHSILVVEGEGELDPILGNR